jgi:hypothetical protein
MSLNLTGTAQDDVLVGRNRADNLDGRGGDDLLVGGGGADMMRGGRGDDVLFGDNGRDTLVGGAGNDVLFGGAGRDTAVFGDVIGNYSFTVLPDGRVVVTGVAGAALEDGSDTIDQIELLRFADGTVAFDDLPCFAAGTRILTPKGEVAVEALSVGDVVVLAGGGTAPILWIGTKTVDIARQRWPDLVRPVRIRAGALADGIPARDLLVSPEHALAIDGKLVPAGLLANGRSILPEAGVARVTYYHVELPAHAVLVAEGAPAESFLDLGHRHLFDGTATPDAHLLPSAARTAAAAWCAPRLEGGPELVALRARLAARAEPGLAFVETTESDLHLVADGRRLRPLGGTRFALPAGAREIRIVSRAACPATMGDGEDRRMLGVALSAIRLRGANGRWLDVPMEDASLTFGFHAAEGAPGQAYRWTDGAALLPGRWLAPFADTAVTVELGVVAAQRSWVPMQAG